jgi:hypothetical protein
VPRLVGIFFEVDLRSWLLSSATHLNVIHLNIINSPINNIGDQKESKNEFKSKVWLRNLQKEKGVHCCTPPNGSLAALLLETNTHSIE